MVSQLLALHFPVFSSTLLTEEWCTTHSFVPGLFSVQAWKCSGKKPQKDVSIQFHYQIAVSGTTLHTHTVVQLKSVSPLILGVCTHQQTSWPLKGKLF